MAHDVSGAGPTWPCRESIVPQGATYVKRRGQGCCWSIRMSPPNCSVRMSPHEDMGDIHDESKGSAPGWAAQGRAGREDQQCARSPSPAPEHPAVSTVEGPLHRG